MWYIHRFLFQQAYPPMTWKSMNNSAFIHPLINSLYTSYGLISSFSAHGLLASAAHFSYDLFYMPWLYNISAMGNKKVIHKEKNSKIEFGKTSIKGVPL